MEFNQAYSDDDSAHTPGAAAKQAAEERDRALAAAAKQAAEERDRALAAAAKQAAEEHKRALAAAAEQAAEEHKRALAAAAEQAAEEHKRALAAERATEERDRALADLEKKLGESKTKIAGLTAENKELEKQLATPRPDTEALSGALEAEKSRLLAENDQLAQELAKWQAKVDDLMKDQVAARTRSEDARLATNELTRTRTAMAEQLEQLRGQVQILENARRTDVAEAEALRDQLAEAQKQLMIVSETPRTPRDADAGDFMARTSLAADAQSTFLQLLRTARPAAPAKAVREPDLAPLSRRSTTPLLSDDE